MQVAEEALVEPVMVHQVLLVQVRVEILLVVEQLVPVSLSIQTLLMGNNVI